MVGFRDGRLGRGLVAEELNEADIVGAVVPDPWHTGTHRFSRRHAGRQRLVINRDQFGRIERLMVGLRDDEGDIVADKPHAIRHQGRIGRAEDTAVAPLEPAGHREITPPRCLPIRPGEHNQHAGRGLCPAHIDRSNARVGMRRAQHMAEDHARQHHVRNIATAALEQPRVLEPGHALTNCEFTHFTLDR